MKNKKLLLTIGVILFILLSFTACSNDNNKKTTSTNIGQTQNSKSKEELKENIKFEKLGITERGDFAFKIINNNNEPVYFDQIYVVFKDENGNFVEKADTIGGFFRHRRKF